jgi:hypothetical protein
MPVSGRDSAQPTETGKEKPPQGFPETVWYDGVGCGDPQHPMLATACGPVLKLDRTLYTKARRVVPAMRGAERRLGLKHQDVVRISRAGQADNRRRAS